MTASPFKGQSAGFTLIEVLIVLAMGAVLMMGITSVLTNTAKLQTDAMALSQIDLVRRDFLRAIESDSAWSNTTKAGTSAGASAGSKMDCLVNGAPCTTDGTANGNAILEQPFALYDNANNLIYDATDPSSGFTLQGSRCAAFSINGNDACPFHFDLKWSASCTPGNCVNPQIKVSGNLIYKPQNSNIALNPANYSIAGYYRMPSAILAAAKVCDMQPMTAQNSYGLWSWNGKLPQEVPRTGFSPMYVILPELQTNLSYSIEYPNKPSLNMANLAKFTDVNSCAQWCGSKGATHCVYSNFSAYDYLNGANFSQWVCYAEPPLAASVPFLYHLRYNHFGSSFGPDVYSGVCNYSGPPCKGTVYGGYCWYSTPQAGGLSCNDVCATHGGVNDATRNFAGSSGTDANCAGVLTALNFMDNSGPICSGPGGNGVTSGPMPCINACKSATFSHFGQPISMSGCAIEIESVYYVGFNFARARCTDGITDYSTVAQAHMLDMSWGFDSVTLACACNL